MELDDVDKDIINTKIMDSTLSYREVAKKVKVSVATVMNRIKRLEKEGVIKRYTTIVDYDKIGYDVEVMVEVRISKGKLFQVEKEIATHKNVFGVYDMTGDFDASIMARFKNRRQMDAFLKKIQTYDFVERTNTRFILNTIKEKQIEV
ncbi:MAG: Lrp/AsnC family transcriptional regulator [Nanoarchaeota archaeon]|nr:Lrp/AsnC family transcriptional regulator [Nanoarchaeota archaeon]MBU1704552.1 Lrp/AsnC family transcriptional regulator [Nanoarchaeota archaeon]